MTSPNDKLRHDFKNHLGIILGFVDLLLEDVSPDDPKRSDLEQIQRSARAALELVNRMLPPATT
jgi:signal transduction histidine kinase